MEYVCDIKCNNRLIDGAIVGIQSNMCLDDIRDQVHDFLLGAGLSGPTLIKRLTNFLKVKLLYVFKTLMTI